MGKKTEVKPVVVSRRSTRAIKKQEKAGPQQFYEEDEQLNQQHSPHDDQDSGSSDQNGQSENSGDEQADDEDDQDEESTPKINPQNYAVRSMQFRERRGTKMTYLINRKKQEEEDPFWAEQGVKFFGDLDDGDNDEDDYVESSSGRDEFDSDFDQSQSEHEPEGSANEQKEVDEQKQKEKKKRQQLKRIIQAPAPSTKRNVVKTNVTTSSTTVKKAQKSDVQKKVSVQPTNRYIHQIFNQAQLLGEAATTEYFNWLSLKKLISIQGQRKDFTKRQHHIEGPKIIYRNRINQLGGRQQRYELCNVTANKIQQLSEMLNKH